MRCADEGSGCDLHNGHTNNRMPVSTTTAEKDSVGS